MGASAPTDEGRSTIPPQNDTVQFLNGEYVPRGALPKRRDAQKEGVPARKRLIEEVDSIINGPRNTTYGESEDNFGRIAMLWRPFFKARYGVDIDITPGDVGLIMALMKIARLAYDPNHKDSWVDLAGYAATGYQAQVTPAK